jgi:CRP-like cAMP-binding protein
MSTDAYAPASSSSANRLLARLPAREYQRLLPALTTVKCRPKRVLLKPHVPSEKIYFLGGGVCSLTQVTADGQVAAVALVGNEGVVGLPEFGGDPESGITAVVEVADADTSVMDLDVFQAEVNRRGDVSDIIGRYAKAFVAGLMQSVVCNALHSVDGRCARCLLELRDRVGSDELPLTQDALADILGVRRPTVTLCAGKLQRMGIVEHHQRRVVIRDPAGLESAASECYRAIKHRFARLLP